MLPLIADLNHEYSDEENFSIWLICLFSQNVFICMVKVKWIFVTAECERQLEMVLGERSNAHDSLVKKENMTANLEAEKKKLEDNIQMVSKNTECVSLKTKQSVVVRI